MLYQTPFYLPFVAVALILYWTLCRNAGERALFLTLSSLAFLGVAQLQTVTFRYAAAATFGAAALSGVVYALAARLRRSPIGLGLALAVMVPMSLLVAFKYAWPIAAHYGGAAVIAIPMGISYYTFKHVGFLIESSRGRFADASFAEYLAYVFFFPMFSAGPIERFGAFQSQLAQVNWSWVRVSVAVERIVIGVLFKFLIADGFFALFTLPAELLALQTVPLAWWQVLTAAFMRFLYTYFDFAGYTHMVIGVGLLFGIKLMENFESPLLRPNLAEFWRGWHISLSSWARDYVYFPLLGRYRSTTIALLATFVLIGLWHSSAPGWTLWGLHHGVGLSLLAVYHRWAQDKAVLAAWRITPGWRVAATLTTWWYVSLGYVLTLDASDVGSGVVLYLRVLTFGVLA